MAAGCTEIITEHASGAERRRPALNRLIGALQRGETLVIVRLDRLARSVAHLVTLVDELDRRGIGLRSLSDPIDTTSPSGRFTLHILAAVAELERALIIERTRAGVAAAARAGRLPGHPGFRSASRETALALGRARSEASRRRAAVALERWRALIATRRPRTAWATIAAEIEALGGPVWTGERLRRTWHRICEG